jgi:hypothetical protein
VTTANHREKGETIPTRAAKDHQLQYQKIIKYSGTGIPTTVTTANQRDCGKSIPTRAAKNNQLQHQKITIYGDDS